MARNKASQPSVTTGARQTMSSWAQVIEARDGVPAVYRSSFDAIAVDGDPFPHTVLAPAIAGLRQKTTEKLLCDLSDTIVVWERLGDHAVMAAYPLGAISDFETGNIHLFSWLTINGVTQTGLASSSTIEFNTASGRHLAPFVKKLRPALPDLGTAEQHLERAKLDYLEATDYKFMNYALESLTGGERIIRTVWQPKIGKPIVRLGRRVLVQSTLIPAHLVMLTDHELIVIEDDERTKEIRGVRYGGKRHFIPLVNISSATRLATSDDRLALSLKLTPGEHQLAFLFASSQEHAVARLLADLGNG